MAVIEPELAWLEQAVDQVALAQLLVAGAGHHVRVGRVVALFEH
jgi:hypothetical protein